MIPGNYFATRGGHPAQTELMTGRAVFTEAYAVIPKGVMRDIVTSSLPHWEQTRTWVIARPMTGFAETFSQYIMEVGPRGGSQKPEPDATAEGAIFMVDGEVELIVDNTRHVMTPGGFSYMPPASAWSLRNTKPEAARFHWIRKRYEPVEGLSAPPAFVTSEADVPPTPVKGAEQWWSNTRFIDPADLRHDMAVTIVTFEPGGTIPFEETHVMEHGLFILEGKAVYRLNRDWVEVEAGDFLWLRAFCPQACYAGGPGRFRYLLYKDVNRHMQLAIPKPRAGG
jgi:(S)-ureidoglycine aminohydrolase